MIQQQIPWFVRMTAARRVAIVVALGVVAYSVQPDTLPLARRLLVSWDVGALAYLILAWFTFAHADGAMTNMRARAYDQSSFAIFLLVLTAACASVIAIGFVMGDVKQASGWARAGHLGLSIGALLFSWALIHTLFAFHYAREYYVPEPGQDAPRRGLKFPGDDDPAYLDFAYYSFVVGMTSQVSDVAVVGRHMRRSTLAHGVLSFIFNIAVLALSINVFSGLI